MEMALTTPLVHFTVLYRLRERAKSLTLPHYALGAPPRLDSADHIARSPVGPSTSPARPSLSSVYPTTSPDRRRPSLLRATVHRDREITSPLPSSPPARDGRSRAGSAPMLRAPFAVTAEIVDTTDATEHAESTALPGAPAWRRGLSPPSAPPPPTTTTAESALLSTMDKRELSKIVLRDAVYAQLLDVVPSRGHVQTAVWTLSESMVQFDGAIAVRPMFEADTDSAESEEAVYTRVAQRVRDMITDATFFAAVLRPYLGEWACFGDVELAQLDGVNV